MKLATLRAEHLPAVVRALKSVAGVTRRGVDNIPSLTRFLTRNPRLSIVAHEGTRLAGFVLSGHDGRRGYLHHLVVLPAYRRQGLGSELVESALGRLQAIGIDKVHVDVLQDNELARAFWSGAGWSPREDIIRFSIITAGGGNA